MKCEIFGMENIKLDVVKIFEFRIKEFIDYHAFISILSISISKLTLDNYGYRIDMTFI